MSVNPGFGGQKLIPEIYRKSEMLYKMIQSSGQNIPIEVDGGVTVDNIAKLAKADIDIFVDGFGIVWN